MAEGYKSFAAASVLAAADLTDYASSQAVMRFASATARDAALPAGTVLEGMTAYLKDTNVITVNTDGTTTGWKQIYPVVTAAISDGAVSTAKLAASAVDTASIANAAVTGAKIANSTITNSNIAAGAFPNINAGSLNGATDSQSATANSIVKRYATGAVEGFTFTATATSGQYDTSATYLYLSNAVRVLTTSDVYSQAVSGRSVYVNVNGTLGTVSSARRFKNDIAALDIPTADILAIEPVSFRYKPEHVTDEDETPPAAAAMPLEYGVIADDVAALELEPMIYRDNDGEVSGFAYDKLAVLLLKVCRDQQAQIDALETRLNAIGGA